MISQSDPEARLKAFYEGQDIEALKRAIGYSHKYQQQVLFNCHRGIQPAEVYARALVSSQWHVMTIINLIIEKSKKEVLDNGTEKTNR
jgi:hypothetical protein